MRCLAILLALTTVGMANADFRVVPGHRIGKVTIGMSTPDLMKALGPTNIGDAAMQKAWATWKGTTGTRVDVYSTQQKVVLIRVTSNRFRDAKGRGPGASATAFSGFKRIAAYDLKGQRTLVFDNLATGYGYETTGDRVTAIIVHKPGTPVQGYLPLTAYVAQTP